MVKYVLSVFLVFAQSVGFADEPKGPYLPADPLKGAVYFTEKGCDKCHSIEGHRGSFGPDLARSDLNRSLFDIVALMWNHSPQMSSMMRDLRVAPPQFTGKELAELAAYVFFIAYFDKPGDIAQGKKVFSRKGCSNCHRVGGIGTRIGPDLFPLKKYVSSIFLAQEMWNHGPRIKAKMDELHVNWPHFEGAEISDLMAFLRDASRDTTSERVFMRPGNPQVGERLFQKKRCITCHRVFDMGTEVGPDLTQSAFHKSVTDVAAVMWNHGPVIWDKMEEIGLQKPTFEGNEMADLIAFLYFLRFFEKEPDVAKGEMLFDQKGCGSCHHFGQAAVEGSFSLSVSEGNTSRMDIAADMWNKVGEMSRQMTRKKMEWPRFIKGEMKDLLQYIISHRKQKQ